MKLALVILSALVFNLINVTVAQNNPAYITKPISVVAGNDYSCSVDLSNLGNDNLYFRIQDQNLAFLQNIEVSVLSGTSGNYELTFSVSNTSNYFVWIGYDIANADQFTVDNFQVVQVDLVEEQICSADNDYRYGFNGMEKDDEAKGSGNSYDFGARMQDPRLGRWLSIDAFSQEYAPISPYVFALNSPCRFVDSDGNIVVGSDGKPVTYEKGVDGTITWSANATEDIKTLGNILLETESGTDLWTQMEDNSREIHIHVVESGDGDKETDAILEHHSSAKIIKENGGRIVGETVNGVQFRKIQEGTFTEDDYTNENAGNDDIGNMYSKKNSLWDETHVIVNLDEINAELKNTDGVAGLTKKASEEQERKYAIGKVGAEEIKHSLQDVTDQGSNYEGAMHEIEAKKTAKKIAKEIKKNIKKEIKAKR